MEENQKFDVIIAGGSYAGLSAAMSLGRAIRKVLIIDSGKPCNLQTPHSHNHLTRDGSTPAEISEIARNQVLAYPTVQIKEGKVISVTGENKNFEVYTESGEHFGASKVLFATGVKDMMPAIPGFKESWGISVIHCPYCHGYEYRDQNTGILTNGEHAFDFTKLIHNWTKTLTIFTNGPAAFNTDVRQKIENLGVNIVENKISKIEHQKGYIDQILFEDGSSVPLKAVYARIPFVQHSDIPEKMGCEYTEHGYIKIDDMQRTSVAGIYAAGDNTTMMRAVSGAIAAGSKSGAIINHDLISEGN